MNPQHVVAKLAARKEAAIQELQQAGIPDYATIREIARYLRVSYNFLWERIQRRELVSVRRGRVYRLRRSDVAAWMTSPKC